ncbi:MAG: beta-lactamase family protein [Anaerolineae bacterium]|nr:beta-lactamase family protein [Anaerolineae bacterium]
MLSFYALEQKINMLMKAAAVPGAALAIIQNRQVMYAQGFGVTSIETNQPVTSDTLFRIGSITKPMTVTAIMQLVEAGKLNLDAPVRDYLPDLKFSEESYAKEVTLRRLLSHTAGLQTHHVPHGAHHPEGLAQYLQEEFPTHEFIAPPGRLYSYSNPGFRVAGRILELMYEKNYTDIMQQQIFDPLDMTRSTFNLPMAMTYPLAQSHDRDENGRLSVQRPFADNTGGYPSGSLMSTVLDVANFAIMHMNNGKFGQNILLSKESIALMQSPHADAHTLTRKGYGLGWMQEKVNGRWWIGHDGSISTFGGKLVMLPDHQIAVILLFNRAAGFWNQALNICHHIIDGLLGHSEPEPFPEIHPNTELWKHYTGTYLGYERGLARIEVEANQLMIDWQGEKHPLQTYYLPSQYFWPRGSVGFIPDANRKIYLMLNGAPCRRIKLDESFQADKTKWAEYEGVYRGAEQVIIRIINDQLTVTHEEYEPNLVCIPLRDNYFAAKLGTIEFLGESKLMLSHTYLLQKL